MEAIISTFTNLVGAIFKIEKYIYPLLIVTIASFFISNQLTYLLSTFSSDRFFIEDHFITNYFHVTWIVIIISILFLGIADYFKTPPRIDLLVFTNSVIILNAIIGLLSIVAKNCNYSEISIVDIFIHSLTATADCLTGKLYEMTLADINIILISLLGSIVELSKYIILILALFFDNENVDFKLRY